MVTSEPPVRRRGECCAVVLPPDPAWAQDAAGLLKALADPTRLAMVWCLRQAAGPVCICDFTACFDLGQPTISHHMAKLRTAGLVQAERRGIWMYYRLRGDLSPAAARLIDALAHDSAAGAATGASQSPPP